MHRNKTSRSMLMLFVFLFLTLGTALPSQALRDRRELLPIADSYVRSSGPDFNWGRAHHLWVASGQEEMISFLMFDLSEIPSDALVEEAALRLYASVVDIETVVGVHYCADNDWTELGITYSNKPEFQPEPLDSANITTALAWYEWNIADTTRSTLGATDKRLSLVVKTETEKEAWITFGSTNPMFSPSESEDWRPRLSVLYSYSPSSGPDPVLIGLIAIGIVGTSIIVLELAYIRRKRRKRTNEQSAFACTTTSEQAAARYKKGVIITFSKRKLITSEHANRASLTRRGARINSYMDYAR